MRVLTMSRLQCTKFLGTQRLGHIACSVNDRPYVVPIHYALDGGAIYSFSMPGKKIEIMRANPHVAIAVEQFSADRTWKSVIVQGRYEELADRIGSKIKREQAWSMLSKHANWWEPGALKPVTEPISDHSEHLFYRIVIDEVSGREVVDSN